MTEAEILSGLKVGDQKVYKVFVDQNKQRIMNLCMGYLGDYEAAQDLSQEIFIEVFKSVSNFRGDSKLTTWLYRIATNKSLNYIRSRKKFRLFSSINKLNPFGNGQELEIADEKSTGVFDNFTNIDDAKMIHSALEKLSENQRTAFILNKYDDFSYKEISEIMEISLANTESLIHRAKKNMKSQLLEYYQNR